MFILIYLPGTDEDPELETFTELSDLHQHVQDLSLYYSDYAIIRGQVVKDFYQNENFQKNS